MNADWEKVESEIIKIESKIVENESRHSEAVDHKNSNAALIEKFETEFEKLLVAKDKKNLGTIKGKLSKLKEETEPSTRLISGLEKQREDLTKQLSEAEQRRNNLLSKCFIRWLSKEANKFDAAVQKVIQHGKRLSSARELLRDRGLGGVYNDAIGPAVTYLPGIKLPTIKNFDRSVFTLGGQFHFSKDLRDKVFEEVVTE